MILNRSFIFLLIVCLSTSCQWAQPLGVSSKAPKTEQTELQKLIQKINQKQPFKGPIRISIDPSLLSGISQKKKDITQAFQTQAVQERSPLLDQTFVANQTAQSFEHEFTLSDIDTRYRLEISLSKPQEIVEVNLNGMVLAKGSMQTTQNNNQYKGLLLHNKNRLKMNFKGSVGASFTVKLFKSTSNLSPLVEHQKLLTNDNVLHRERILNNEINIFDPESLLSLGGLKPYQGDILLEHPRLSGAAQHLAGVLINEKAPIHFESGIVVLEFKEPEVGLELFREHYGTEVLQEIDGFYRLKLDMSKAPLLTLPELIRAFNLNAAEDIESLNFSSLSAMQTLAILFDALKRFPQQIRSIDLNVQAEAPASFTDVNFNDIDSRTFLDTKGNPLSNWSLNETKVLNAWDYSIGTGVTAAWLDYGYNINHPELTDRVVLGKENFQSWAGLITDRNDSSLLNESTIFVEIGILIGRIKTTKDDAYNTPIDISYQSHHGHGALMTAFAQRENIVSGKKSLNHTVGVAPNAKVIPYHATFSFEYAAAIREARNHDVKLIGLNMNWKIWNFGTFLQFAQETILGTLSGGNIIDRQIEDALREGRIVVVAAHNHHEPIEDWTPTRRLKDWDNQGLSLIVVGSVQPYDNITAAPQGPNPTPVPVITPLPVGATPAPTAYPYTPLVLSANYDPEKASVTDIVDSSGKGSNYGEGMIWAPGKLIPVSNLNGTDPIYYSGTSAATPFVTGVVALMLSRNPNLTPHEVREKLRAARGPVIKPNPGMVSHGISPAYLLDAEKAVKSVASVPKAETYFATLFESGNQKTAIFNKAAQLSANNNGGLEQSKQLMDSVSREVWNALRGDKLVKITGWSDSMPNFKAGDQNLYQRFEVLDAEVICDVNNCTNPSAAFDPKLTNVTATKDAAGDIILELQGENLIADVSGNAQVRILLEHMTLPVGFSNAQEELVFLKSGPSRSGEIVEISNKGDYVKLKIAKDRLDPSLTTPDPTGFKVRTGSYKIAFRNTITKKNSNFIDNSTGFNISSTTSGGGGILIQSDAPIDPPPGHYVYNQIGNRWIREGDRVQLESNEFAGLYFTKPIRELTVKVGPVELPVVSVLKDLAVFGIPEDLPAGVHELTVEVDGQTLTLKDAIEKITPAVQPTPFPSPPPSGFPGLYSGAKVYNVEGNDEARVFLNGQKILTVHAGEEKEVPFITGSTTGSDTVYPLDATRPNELIFEYENRGGGYSLGFDLRSTSNYSYSQHPFFHEQGKAGTKNVVNRDGTEDQTQGVVFRKRFLVHRLAYPVGSGRLWVKFFNLDDDESFTTSATYNELNDIQWNQPLKVNPGLGNEWVKGLPFPNQLMCEGQTSGSQECWNSYGVNLENFENSTGGFSYGIELYRGVDLVYHKVHGQPKGWGANDDNQQAYIPGSYQQPDYFPYQVLIPIYNNYLGGYPWWLDN